MSGDQGGAMLCRCDMIRGVVEQRDVRPVTALQCGGVQSQPASRELEGYGATTSWP